MQRDQDDREGAAGTMGLFPITVLVDVSPRIGAVVDIGPRLLGVDTDVDHIFRFLVVTEVDIEIVVQGEILVTQDNIDRRGKQNMPTRASWSKSWSQLPS